ncbi:MAG: hypothetical protein Q9167_005271 [Letrouitia subvulpina]
MTKVWPHGQYPLRKVGRIQLNRNPSNWFQEIEQAAFSPSNMVPGIEPSPDPMLQARMFAYPDAARYRLGVNYQFLPANAAASQVYCPIERDGLMNFTHNYGTDPNYIGTKLQPVSFWQKQQNPHLFAWQESSDRSKEKATEISTITDDQVQVLAPVSVASKVEDKDYEQATALWCIMKKQDGAQKRFVDNLSAHVSGVKTKWLREDVYAMFAKVAKELGEWVRDTTETKIENDHLHPQKSAWH